MYDVEVFQIFAFVLIYLHRKLRSLYPGNREAGIPEVWPHPISGGFWLSPPVPGDQGRLSQAARLSPLSEL